jgi:uncharacterized membrane protein YqjE
MTTDIDSGPETSMAATVSGIIKDVQTLVRQELALARCELKDELRKAARSGILLGGGVGLTVVGATFLLLTLAYLLNWAVPALPLWSCVGLIGGPLTLAGCGLLWRSRSRAEGFELMPRTAEALKDNLEWTKSEP